MTMIIGHRGARNLWAENSLSGFRNLKALPVEGVEFDIHRTRTGELVVIHDPMLDRTTNGSGRVEALDAASRPGATLKDSLGETVPSLDDVLAIFEGTSLELHVELKTDVVGNPYPGMEAEVCAAIRARKLGAQAIVTCFAPEVLEKLRDAAPEMRRLASVSYHSAMTMGGLETMLDRFDALVDVIAVEKALLLEGWDVITRRIPLDRLGVWVPNTVEDLAFWSAKGLRQLTSDRPDLAVSVRQALSAA